MNQPEQDNLEFELSQYLDGELSGRRARRLERRLAGDAALREELKKYAALGGRLSSLARKGPPGADYDSQREELLRMLERKRLLEQPRRRPVVLRPVFAAVSGGLAAAAAIIIGIAAWMSPRRPGAPPPASEVHVVVVAPAVPRDGLVQVEMDRMDPGDYRFPEVAAGWGPPEIASEPEPPPGTVLVSISPTPKSPRGDGAFPFPVEF